MKKKNEQGKRMIEQWKKGIIKVGLIKKKKPYDGKEEESG